MKVSKRDKIIVVSILTIALSFFIWIQVSMNWSKNACAKILYIERSRGYYVWFIYDRNGYVVKDNMALNYFKYGNIQDLQQKECCKIKYSIYWPYRVEIIDKDLKAE